MPLRYLIIPICSLCWSLDSLVTVHKVLNAFEISKYTCLLFVFLYIAKRNHTLCTLYINRC